MRYLTRVFGVLLFASLMSLACATGSIRLYSYPYLSLADGSSTVTVSAEVHTSGGSLVPDGTDVRFTTTLGSFRDLDAKTTSGVARAILVAPNTAGVAKVTVTVPSVGAVNTFDVEFVS